MEYIAHRINTVKDLKTIPAEYGVELDLRDNLKGDIYISHNPFEDGDNFETYLQNYQNGTMILNIKSERIEHKILELLKKYNIQQYFFLDSSFPMIKLLSDMGEKNIALRFSEYEGIDTLKAMKGLVNWVWVDCFTRVPLDRYTWEAIKHMGYKLCFVSPELQGQSEKIYLYAEYIKEQGISFDAVCTKIYKIDDWKTALSLEVNL